MAGGTDVLAWLHIGDLHVTGADEQNYRDLKRIAALMADLRPGSLDFAVLPGDNADDGTPDQFRLVRAAIAGLPLAVHILAGDHDFKQRTLDAFHSVLGAEAMPRSVIVRHHRCLFLDVVSAGSGGPDFRLDDAQLDWLEHELRQARASAERAVIFMHTYPADLRAGTARLSALLTEAPVACVDMGHTHYNEIANDGRTVFLATRSTGQIEEGPPGFSVAAIDGGGVSWRFKPLDDAWPCVLITRPVDRRLMTGSYPAASGWPVRAKVISDAPIEAVDMRIGDGPWTKMAPAAEAPALWQASGLEPRSGARIAVRARDACGRTDEDRIEPPGPGWTPPAPAADGSDRDRVGAWPEKSILGSQLGPNRNGRHW